MVERDMRRSIFSHQMMQLCSATKES